MSITSTSFLAFIVAIIGLYFFIRPKWQWVVLLGGSICFYWMAMGRSIIYLFTTVLITYLGGLWLDYENCILERKIQGISGSEKKKLKKDSKRKKKIGIFFVIIFNLGILIVLKYGNFIGENVSHIYGLVGRDFSYRTHNFIVPLGISFYTLQSIGYIFDLYRGKMVAERNLAKYTVLVSFFPQIIQGPFNRYKNLSTSLFRINTFNYNRFLFGIQRMLWGFVKKIVLADRLGLLVDPVFLNSKYYSGTQIFIAAIAYTIQIYADFSGYMDIMCGFCQVLDIEMAENFKRPYFSKSVAEFWRRWHITLGMWFREYMFYPISMSKKANRLGSWARKTVGVRFGSLLPSYVALIAVWFCTGLWHGTNWTYVIWALINVFFILTSMQFEETYSKCRMILKIKENSFGWKSFQVIRTFLLVCFMRIFSRGVNVRSSINMYKKIFTEFDLMDIFRLSTYKIGLSNYDLCIVLVFTIVMFIVSFIQRKGSVREQLAKRNLFVRWFIYLGMIASAVLFASTEGGGSFLYAVF